MIILNRRSKLDPLSTLNAVQSAPQATDDCTSSYWLIGGPACCCCFSGGRSGTTAVLGHPTACLSAASSSLYTFIYMNFILIRSYCVYRVGVGWFVRWLKSGDLVEYRKEVAWMGLKAVVVASGNFHCICYVPLLGHSVSGIIIVTGRQAGIHPTNNSWAYQMIHTIRSDAAALLIPISIKQ